MPPKIEEAKNVQSFLIRAFRAGFALGPGQRETRGAEDRKYSLRDGFLRGFRLRADLCAHARRAMQHQAPHFSRDRESTRPSLRRAAWRIPCARSERDQEGP